MPKPDAYIVERLCCMRSWRAMKARSSSVVTRVMRKQEESGGALVVAMPQAKSKKMDSKHGEEVATPPHPIASLVRSGVLMPPRSSVSPSPSVLHPAVHVPPPFLHPNPRAACRLSQLLTRSSALGDGSTAVPTLSHSQWPAGCGVVTAMWLWCGDCDVAVVWWLRCGCVVVAAPLRVCRWWMEPTARCSTRAVVPARRKSSKSPAGPRWLPTLVGLLQACLTGK